MSANRGNCAGSLSLLGAHVATPVTGCVRGAQPASIAMAPGRRAAASYGSV